MQETYYKYYLKERRKLRRRFKIKTLISMSREEKFLIYVMRSNKNLHISLLKKDGKVLINANTIKVRRENINKPRRDLICPLAESFSKKLLELYPNIKPSQLVYDIFHYQYEGVVKSCIDKIKEVVLNHERSK